MAAGDKHIETRTQGINITEEEITKLKALSDISQDMRDALDSAASTLGVSEKVFEEIIEHLEDIREDSGNIFDDVENYYDTLKSISSILRDNLETLTKGRSPINETKSITTQLVHEAEKLQQIRNLGNLVSVAEYNTEKSKLELDKVRLESLGKQLGFNESIASVVSDRNRADLEKSSLLGNISAEESEVKRLQIRIKEIGKDYRKAFSYDSASAETKSLENKLGLYKQLLAEQEKGLEKDRSRLAVLDDMAAVLSLQAEYEKEKDISRLAVDEARTVTGNTPLKTKIMRTAGLQDLAEKEQFASDETQRAIKSAYTVAKEAGKSEKEAWEIAHTEGEKTYKALKPKWDDLGKSLKNAAISWLLANIIKQFNEVDDLAAKLKQNIGTWEHSAAAANLQFATSKDYLQAALDIAEKFYINPSVIFTSEEMGKIAEAKNLLGLSNAEASNLAMYSKAAGISAEQYKDGIEAGFKSYNSINKTAVNHGQVLRETLRTSDAIRLSVGGTGKGLAEAAAAALSIGMNLEQVQRIAQSLINFESSIESEMTAQLLTGQQMNLAKARELALNNDLEGVVREISHQGVDMVKFGQWNYIQQENFAKALGMSRDELAKMLVLQGIQKGLSEDQIEANMNISKKQIHAMSTMQEWKVATEQLIQSVTPLVKIFATILDFLSMIISKISGFVGWVASLFGFSEKAANSISKFTNSLILGLTLALPLIGKVATGVRGIITAYSTGFSTIKSAWIGLVAFIRKRPLVPTEGPVFSGGRWRDAATGKFVKAPVSAAPAASMSSTAAAGGAKATGTMSKTVGGLGKNMGNLLKGAAAAAILAGAVFILAKACQEFAKIDSLGKALLGATVGLGILVGAVALLGMVMTSGVGAVAIIAGAAAMLIVAGAVWVLGKALGEFQNIKFSALLDGASALALFGLALLPFSVGLLAAIVPIWLFPTKEFGKIIDHIAKLKGLELKGMGSAFTGLASGITALASAVRNLDTDKLAALSDLKSALTKIEVGRTVEIVTEPIQTQVRVPAGQIEAAESRATVAQAKTEEVQRTETQQVSIDLSNVEEKLGQLLAAVKEGKNIYLNGDKVGQTLAWSTTSM